MLRLIITKSTFNESCRNNCKDRKIPQLPSLYISNQEIFYSKNRQHSYFTINSSITQYSNHRTYFCEITPFCSCITLVNSPPTHIQLYCRGHCLRDQFYGTSPFTGVPSFGIGEGHVVGPEWPSCEVSACILLDVSVHVSVQFC